MTKISLLPDAVSLSDGDYIPISQGGITGKMQMADYRDDIRSQNRWRILAASRYTATPVSATRLTMSDTTAILVGAPMRVFQDTVYKYGIVTAVSANAYVDIIGVPLGTGTGISSLELGLPEMVAVMDFFVSGSYAVALQADLIRTYVGYAPLWSLSPGFLVGVRFSGRVRSSTPYPKVNVLINGYSRSLTSDSGLGLEMIGVSGAPVSNVAGSIDPAHYRIVKDQTVDLEVTLAGGTSIQAQDLTATLTFILE